jgi:hypothetical protein
MDLTYNRVANSVGTVCKDSLSMELSQEMLSEPGAGSALIRSAGDSPAVFWGFLKLRSQFGRICNRLFAYVMLADVRSGEVVYGCTFAEQGDELAGS